MTKFRIVEIENIDSPNSTSEWKVGALERTVAAEETDGYVFHSLTFCGATSTGPRFVAAFRKPSAGEHGEHK